MAAQKGDIMLDRYLAKFDRMIAREHYARITERYRQIFAWDEVDELPYTWTTLPPVVDEDWPSFAYNDTFRDREKMLLDQLRAPYLHYQSGDYYPLAIRANYGTVILPTILGAGYQLTETSLPWAHHLPDRQAIQRVIDGGVPDLRAGLGAACFDTAEYYRETLAPYPQLAQEVQIYHPDLQGPFDVAHLIWGPDIFVAFYDCPELVHALLDVVVRTYVAWLTRWKELSGEGSDLTAHWSFLMRGGAMLRNDTSVMLSRAQYEEFVKPYDQRVLDTFGGCIHFCGRGNQFVEPMAASHNLFGLNISQPELNDMAKVWREVQAHRLVLLGLAEEYVPVEVRTGVALYRTYEPGQAGQR
jgi:hypothetical protein